MLEDQAQDGAPVSGAKIISVSAALTAGTEFNCTCGRDVAPEVTAEDAEYLFGLLVRLWNCHAALEVTFPDQSGAIFGIRLELDKPYWGGRPGSTWYPRDYLWGDGLRPSLALRRLWEQGRLSCEREDGGVCVVNPTTVEIRESQGLEPAKTEDAEKSPESHDEGHALAPVSYTPLAVTEEGDLAIRDSNGTIGWVKAGTAAWAALVVLGDRRGQVIAVKELAKLVDSSLEGLCSEAIAKARMDSKPEDGDELQLDGDDQFERMQLRGRARTAPRTLYRALEDTAIIQRVQAVIRKVRGDRARRWRDRWIHWDNKTNTVVFEYRE